MTEVIFDLLKEAMQARFGGSVTRLAEGLDVSVQLAAKWVSENPRVRVTPGPASCAKIATALNLDPDYVLEAAGHRMPRGERQQLDPRLASFLAEIEAGWRQMDEAARDLAERGVRAMFAVPPANRRPRRVTDQPGEFGRPKMDNNRPEQPRPTRRNRESVSVSNMRQRYGFMPA